MKASRHGEVTTAGPSGKLLKSLNADEAPITSDLARIDLMNDSDIDYSDIPELDDEFFARARHPMLYAITAAIARPDHTVTVTWSDGMSATVSLAPYLDKGAVFEPLKDPDHFTREMRVMPGGIGLAWPNEVDFSADGLRHEAFPQEPPPMTDDHCGPKPSISFAALTR